ncbi:hypothetical protein SETIT_3G172900v2 [Setaria italica]|uniref:Protein kinase domain-containing protein n=1 Tax=Setaria italica TaxID=4555 RepID=A0A368QFV2_SETIT|nr:hypothetical protein SETIT_3G172900v2 [Setaria italica]
MAPSEVMQTAITPRNGSNSIEFYWFSEPQPGDPTVGYIAIFHFSEQPPYLLSDCIYNTEPLGRFARYNFSIDATANSTLPPIINAGEVFFVISTSNVGTDSSDVSAIAAIKAKYQSSFAKLKAIQYLDLTSNQLSGSIPAGLVKRIQDGSLTLRYGNNPNLCTNADSCKPQKGKSKLAIYIAVPLVLVVVMVSVVALLFLFMRRKKQGSTSMNNTVRPQNKPPMSYAPAPLPPGKDGQYMALVYEYMSEGTLREQIAGNGRSGKRLTWRQRLRIALDSAQGLEYLHKGCNPPLIHRDVKATNILLNAELEAKIDDFSLSKVFNHDDETQLSMNTLVGAPGCVDPEYQATMQPTTKSDVYIFGVVLLELVTGRQATQSDPEPTSIIQWVRRRLAQGNIEDVVDTRMRGEYDVNSVWKVADFALKCTMQAPMQQPTMTDVVAQLQECLELGEGQSTHMSQISTAFKMGHNFGKMSRMGGGPIAR